MISQSWWSPTMQLRFVERQGSRVLQQAWEEYHTFEPAVFPPDRAVEWRDVPFVPCVTHTKDGCVVIVESGTV